MCPSLCFSCYIRSTRYVCVLAMSRVLVWLAVVVCLERHNGESGWGYEASRFEGVHTLELLLCLQLCMSGGFAGTRVLFPRRSMHSIMPA